MRRFRDRGGREWDVVLGRESWGSIVALFVPVISGATPVRQASMQAVSHDAANQELDGLDDSGLQALLDRSAIKDEGQT